MLNPALEQGTQVLGRTPALNARLQQTMQALKTLAAAPGTNIALNALVEHRRTTLNPMVRYLGPFQTVCDDWNYWWTYLAEHISEATCVRDRPARAADAEQLGADQQRRSDQGATAPVDGGSFDSPRAATSTCTARSTARPSTTRATPTARPASAATRRSSTTSTRRAATSTPIRTRRATRARRSPASAHVPAGETFTRTPQTGIVTPPVPGNN